MISLIVCSRNHDVPKPLKDNVEKTIGDTMYEWVVIDNSQNRYSIFQAYNEGVRLAKGEILCFMHEDIEYQSFGWGATITDLLKDESIGVIGFGGCHFLPSTPMYWSSSPIISECFRHNDHGREYDCIHERYFKGDLVDVIACDGFCFFMPKQLFEQVRFDDTTYEGFHGYDMDICMQALSQGYRVCVCRKMMVMHRWSDADFSKKKGSELFEKNISLFADKWKSRLPLMIGIDDDLVDFHALDVLCAQAYEAKQLQHSKEYFLGRKLLHSVRRK